jgi:hypothetical protein
LILLSGIMHIFYNTRSGNELLSYLGNQAIRQSGVLEIWWLEKKQSNNQILLGFVKTRTPNVPPNITAGGPPKPPTITAGGPPAKPAGDITAGGQVTTQPNLVSCENKNWE